MESFLISFFLSFLICSGVVFYSMSHNELLLDTFDGPQKFHHKHTPRIGGLGVFVAFSGVIIFLYSKIDNVLFVKLLLSSLPVFIFGFAEDITKRIRPLYRLLAAALSAGLFIYLSGYYLERLDIIFLGVLFRFKFFAMAITIFAVAGVSNSINIIDGFNGLASMVSMIILTSIVYVAFKVSDTFVMSSSLILIGAILGFFIWNYPFGKIFLGDGGAYFIGFMIAVLSIMLVVRNPVVSPWFPLLAAIYPIFETLFSMYRRKFIHKTDMGKPDAHHLHQLIYKRVVPVVLDIQRIDKLMKNSATSPFLWLICSIGAIPAVLFYKETNKLITFTFIFCFLYIMLYKTLEEKTLKVKQDDSKKS